jgi:D-glycero-D-manno-heptose 1,7-bisphosphate phosphatase
LHAIAAFLDRDGTITDQSGGFLNTPEQMQAVPFMPGAVEALKRLQALGYQLHVVTNQGGVGAGYVTEFTLCEMHLVLFDRLKAQGVHLSSIKSCKHKPDAGCECRKPKPGMLHSISQRFSIDLSRSVMIGNDPTDVQAGDAAGCRRSYLLTPERGWKELMDLYEPAAVESSLA